MLKLNQKNNILLTIFNLVVPILILTASVIFLINNRLLKSYELLIPPIEKIYFERIRLEPEVVRINLMNDGPQPVTIAQVLINKAYWQFDIKPKALLLPLEKAEITVHYPWETGEAENIILISSTGVLFETDVEAALESPSFNLQSVLLFILIGVFVGVIPVFLGLSWYPALKRFGIKLNHFILSLTVGLLVFLGIDALAETLELAQKAPETFNGNIIAALGILSSIMILRLAGSRINRPDKSVGTSVTTGIPAALPVSYFIAIGIGLHNLGEGLSIGSAYTLGEAALGSALIVGFMIHNITEGVAVISPILKNTFSLRKLLFHLLFLGIIGGIPTIAGTLLGGFAYNPVLAVLFFALGTGAILNVAYDIAMILYKSKKDSFLNWHNSLGFISGIVIMYLTGLLTKI